MAFFRTVPLSISISMSKYNGVVYLIPVPLAEDALHTLPEQVRELSCMLRYFFVENIRTARRHLKRLDKSVDIDAIEFAEMNNQVAPDMQLLERWLKEGKEIGVMSEAGCPGMADPGTAIAAKAQQLGCKVIPLIGPSSFLLALMASGFSGQHFRFAGYLPVKEPHHSKAIRELEILSAERKETQIFIETPYRNNQLLKDLIRLCRKNTLLCIAADITAAEEYIVTRSIEEWSRNPPDLHKRPVIFLLMAG